VSRAVLDRVSYASEPGDDWKPAERTWEEKRGDCEDFAICVTQMCAEAGIQADMYVVYEEGNREAHAIAVGEKDGRTWLSSNGKYKEIESLPEAAGAVSKELGWNTSAVKICKADKLRSAGGNSAPPDEIGSVASGRP
jgi:hypothetical protein